MRNTSSHMAYLFVLCLGLGLPCWIEVGVSHALPGQALTKSSTPSPLPLDLEVHSIARRGGKLTTDQVIERERRLLSNPGDEVTRIELLSAYKIKRFVDPSVAKKYEDQVLWMIENRPLHPAHASPITELDPVLSGDAFLRGAKMWQEKINGDSKNVTLLAHASEFLQIWQPQQAIGYLKKAKVLEPGNPEWSRRLSFVYSLNADSDEMDHSQSKKEAFSEIERSLSLQSKSKIDLSPNDLFQAADAAFEAGDFDRAKEYASKLTHRSDCGFADFAHKGHQILGRVELSSGNVELAKKLLLVSVEKTDGPVLRSFGPQFDLARELLKLGAKDEVLNYLERVRQFWKPAQVDQWREQILSNGTSSFKMDYSLHGYGS